MSSKEKFQHTKITYTQQHQVINNMAIINKYSWIMDFVYIQNVSCSHVPKHIYHVRRVEQEKTVKEDIYYEMVNR